MSAIESQKAAKDIQNREGRGGEGGRGGREAEYPSHTLFIHKHLPSIQRIKTGLNGVVAFTAHFSFLSEKLFYS